MVMQPAPQVELRRVIGLGFTPFGHRNPSYKECNPHTWVRGLSMWLDRDINRSWGFMRMLIKKNYGLNVSYVVAKK